MNSKLSTAIMGLVFVPVTWLTVAILGVIIEIVITKWAMGGVAQALTGAVAVGCIITIQVVTLTELVAPIFLDAKRMVFGNEKTQV